MTYAFTFDASACSGCKACQEACKDKNNLPVGVMWRRVLEVSGGEWMTQNGSWENSVFAYNLSIACNHCVHPKCAGVCPTDAYVHRKDGIVYIDPNKCMGCGYCAWACPYNAPRYNFDLGQMAKCNFCFDNIDAGLPPSCVAACPMRVLDFVEVDNDEAALRLRSGRKNLWEIPATEHPFPLPVLSRTEPHLAVKLHKAMSNSLEKAIANYEEIRPRKEKSEASLVAFTLLAQMSVGMAWAWLWMTDSLPLIPYLLIGVCLAAGGFFSFAHLGAKRNAWRAPFHLKKSWLSREILTAGLFGASWLAGFVLPEIKWFTALLGAVFVYSMAMVYRLHVMPAWDTWRTTAGFFITAALLGHVLMANILLLFESWYAGNNLSLTTIQWVFGMAIALLSIQMGLWFATTPRFHQSPSRLRAGLIVAAILGAGVLIAAPNQSFFWISGLIFLAVIAEEIVGRRLFYQELDRKEL